MGRRYYGQSATFDDLDYSAPVGRYPGGADGGALRGQLRQAVRSAWDSPDGQAMRMALASSVPRAEMARRMAPLREPIHRALAPLGPQLSRAYSLAWGSSSVL